MRPWLFAAYEKLAAGEHDVARTSFEAIVAAGEVRGHLGIARALDAAGREPERAWEHYAAAARGGAPGAAHILTSLLVEGSRPAPGLDAFAWLEASAKEHSSFAANHAGLARAGGLHGQTRDAAAADGWFALAVQIDGDPAAWLNRGDLREDGVLPGGPSEAAMCYVEAAASIRRRLEAGPGADMETWLRHLLVSSFAKLHVGRPALEAAADAGDLVAHLVLYHCHEDALLEAPDPARARRHLESASEGGEPRAAYRRAMDETRNAELAEVTSLLRTAAEGGVAGAAAELAGRYARGFGVAEDRGKAVELYERAAAGGDVRAMFLAASYLDQRGEGSDQERASRWLDLAAHRGSVRAMLEAGRRLRDGVGGTPDFARAVAWWVKAKGLGNGDGMREAWALVPKMSPDALELSDRLADAGDHWLHAATSGTGPA